MEALGRSKSDAQLIGQFGVGFYSGFIVADQNHRGIAPRGPPRLKACAGSSGTGDFEVETITRRNAAPASSCTCAMTSWVSERLETQIAGEQILRPHQPAHPDGKEEWKDSDKEGEPGAMVKTGEWETVNQASALWTRPKNITAEQYQGSTKHQPRPRDPLAWAHNRVEGNSEYTQLLYIPAKAPFDLYPRQARGHQAVRQARVHHGRCRGAHACSTCALSRA